MCMNATGMSNIAKSRAAGSDTRYFYELTRSFGFTKEDICSDCACVLKAIWRKLGCRFVGCWVVKRPTCLAGRGTVNKHGTFRTVFMTDSDPRRRIVVDTGSKIYTYYYMYERFVYVEMIAF